MRGPDPTDFWQDTTADKWEPPYRRAFPARLPDGRSLALPIRELADGTAVASMIINQASFAVVDDLARFLADKLRLSGPDVVVGLPTLGLTLAAAVARQLGHTRYVPFGTSRKFWYDEGLSVPLTSITTPGAGRRLYIDPRMLPLLEGRRIALVDDVISTGRSITAALDLLHLAGLAPTAIGAAMLQTNAWRTAPSSALPGWTQFVNGVFETPRLIKQTDGWVPQT